MAFIEAPSGRWTNTLKFLSECTLPIREVANPDTDKLLPLEPKDYLPPRAQGQTLEKYDENLRFLGMYAGTSGTQEEIAQQLGTNNFNRSQVVTRTLRSLYDIRGEEGNRFSWEDLSARKTDPKVERFRNLGNPDLSSEETQSLLDMINESRYVGLLAEETPLICSVTKTAREVGIYNLHSASAFADFLKDSGIPVGSFPSTLIKNGKEYTVHHYFIAIKDKIAAMQKLNEARDLETAR